MSSKKSVDDIWAQLKASTGPAKPKAGSVVVGVGIKAVKPKQQKRKEFLDTAHGSDDIGYGDGSIARAKYDPEEVGLGQGEVDAFQACIQRDINCLLDPDRATRKRAVQTLYTKLVDDSGTTPAMLQAVLLGQLLERLCRLLADPVEKCREVALQLLHAACEVIPTPQALLPAVLPVLMQRMGVLPVLEGTEEIRLRIVAFLDSPVLKRAGMAAPHYMSEICAVIARGLEDSFHEVKRTSCSCLVRLMPQITAEDLQGQVDKLLQALLPVLGHPHSKVRLAAVEALDALVVKGVSLRQLSDVVVPGAWLLTSDKFPAVRAACFSAAARNGVAGEYCAAYAALLLPFLLLGVTDDDADVASSCLLLLEGCGSAFQLAKGADRSQPPCSADCVSEHAAAGGDDEGTGPMERGAAEDSASSSAAEVFAVRLGPPYRGRPSTSARAMVQSAVPEMMGALLLKLREWTVTARHAAARTLHTLLVFAESAAVPHIGALLPALVSAVGDDNPEIAAAVIRATHVLGVHGAIRHWLPLAMELVTSAKATPGQRASALLVLAALQFSASSAGQRIGDSDLALLTSGLVSEEVRGSKHSAVNQQLLSAVRNTMRLAGSCEEPARQAQLLLVLLYLRALPDADLRRQAGEALAELAQAAGRPSAAALTAEHAEGLLDIILAEHQSWTGASADHLVLAALLRTMDAAKLEQVVPRLAPVLRGMLDVEAERDAALRLALLELVDQLLEDGERGAALAGPTNAQQLIKQVLLPPLVWRAGKVAAAIRFKAVSALDTLLRRRLVGPPALKALLAKGDVLPEVFSCLQEDWYHDTRHCACSAVTGLLSIAGKLLDNDLRRAIYPELTKRLDDSNNTVRIAACSALRTFAETMPPDYCETNTGYLVKAALIHMDDSDPQVQEAVCSALEAFAAKRPTAVKAEVVQVYDNFRAKHYCDRLLAALQG